MATGGGNVAVMNILTRLAKWFLAGVFAVMLLTAAIVVAGYWANNRPESFPSKAEIRHSRDKAAAWLIAHQSEILSDANPALWWMVRDSGIVSGNVHLKELYGKYYARHLRSDATNIWHHFFDSRSAVQIPVYRLGHFPDYNLLFLYGLSCQADLRNDSRLTRFLAVDACPRFATLAYREDSACATHQLMGIHFMRQRACQGANHTAALFQALQDRIVLEATWDFRLVDPYVQKVLMLAESGAADRIKPRWLRRILDAQRPDGGWDDFEVLVSLGSQRALGWSGGSVRTRLPQSNFHTTAQGLYLMSLLEAGAAGALDRKVLE